MIIFKKLTLKSIFYDTHSRGRRSHDRMEAGLTCLYTNPFYYPLPSKFVNSIPALTEVYLITNQADRHKITLLLLRVAINTRKQKPTFNHAPFMCLSHTRTWSSSCMLS